MADFKLRAVLEWADKTKAGIEKSSGGLGGLKKMVGATQVALSGMAVMGAAKAGYELAQLGAQSIRTRTAFTAISGSADEATDRFEAMQRATRGAMSEMDMMAAANRLMQMGLADNAVELEKMTTMAVRLGSAMGKDATAAIEEWSLLLANQSIPRLDTFGVSAGKVRTRIKELQAATAGMTREEAFMIATMEEGEAAMLRLGDAVEDEALAFEQLDAAIANLRAEAGMQLAPTVSKASGALADLAQNTTDWYKAAREGEIQGNFFTRTIDSWEAALGGASTTLGGSLLPTMEETEEEFRLLRDAVEGSTNVIGYAKVATEELGVSQEELKGKMGALSEAMRGDVGRQNERYVSEQERIQTEIAEVTAELERLQASQGRTVFSQDELTLAQYDAEKAAARLSEAQQELAENTEPEHQLELESAIINASQAQERANKAVADAAPYTTNYSGRINELQGELGGLRGELDSLATEHREAMNQIVFDMMSARLATDGWTEAEVNLATTVAEQMGLIDESTATTMTNMNTALTEFAEGAPIEETIAKIGAIAEEAAMIPEEPSIALQEEGFEESRGKAESLRREIDEDLNQAMDDATEKVEGVDYTLLGLDGTMHGAAETSGEFQSAMLNNQGIIAEAAAVAYALRSHLENMPRDVRINVAITQTGGVPAIPGGGGTTGGAATIAGGSEQRHGSGLPPVQQSYGGDTYIINNPLAAATIMEQKRRQRRERAEVAM